MPKMTLVVPTPTSNPHRGAGKPNELIYRLTIEQYHEMVRAGIVTDEDRVELLEGWLVAKMSKNPPHVIVTKRVQRALDALLPEGFHTRTQDPITLADSEPEPDVVVTRGNEEQYRERHPGPQETPLIVEVADSTLVRDRGMKLEIYAAAGIPVYWIINLLDQQIEVYEAPVTQPAGYKPPSILKAGQVVPVTIDGQRVGDIGVSDILA
jgi:Uma2 family endonuclease